MKLPVHPTAGVCLHIASLPGDGGIGELGTAARDFVDVLAAAGLTTWQVLPFGPCGYGDSPYQPLSSFAGNEQLIDLGQLVALGLLSQAEVEPIAELPREAVDYERLLPLKSAALRTAARRFLQTADAHLMTEYEQFVALHETLWLRDYAAYRTLKRQHGERSWLEWPAGDSLHAVALKHLGDEQLAGMQEVRVQQFLFYRQWSALRSYAHERGIRLMGDMPIYLSLDSADAWSHTELLDTDRHGRPVRVAGVPPDYFSADGQLWGNPLYAWDAHARDGFRWWCDRVQHAVSCFDAVRIDHFRGFESYWSVAAGAATAREGRWEPGPGDALFHALRDRLGELPLVAEDLGIITPAVEALRDRQRLPGMRVLQFDVVADDFALTALRPETVCYTGTHDNDTTAGWFAGLAAPDVRARVLKLTGGSADSIAADMLQLALASPCWLAMAPLQDCLGLGSTSRLNTPGTTGNNWRWRVTAAQLEGSWRDRLAQQVAAGGRASSG